MAILAFARPASADWHFTPFVGITFGGNSTFPGSENLLTGGKFFGRKDLVTGAAVSHIRRGIVGVEGIFVYVPSIFDEDPDAQSVLAGSYSLVAMGNVVLTIPRAWNEHGLRPFVSGGVGMLHLTQTTVIPDALPVRRTVWGYNLGGGAVGFVSDRTGLRFEVRRFGNLKSAESAGVSVGSSETITYWTATVGIVFRY